MLFFVNLCDTGYTVQLGGQGLISLKRWLAQTMSLCILDNYNGPRPISSSTKSVSFLQCVYISLLCVFTQHFDMSSYNLTWFFSKCDNYNSICSISIEPNKDK